MDRVRVAPHPYDSRIFVMLSSAIGNRLLGALMQQAVNMVVAGVLHDVVDDTDPDILLVLCCDMNSMIHDEHYIVTNGLFCQSD
jgi:hypothetical protein